MRSFIMNTALVMVACLNLPPSFLHAADSDATAQYTDTTSSLDSFETLTINEFNMLVEGNVSEELSQKLQGLSDDQIQTLSQKLAIIRKRREVEAQGAWEKSIRGKLKDPTSFDTLLEDDPEDTNPIKAVTKEQKTRNYLIQGAAMATSVAAIASMILLAKKAGDRHTERLQSILQNEDFQQIREIMAKVPAGMQSPANSATANDNTTSVEETRKIKASDLNIQAFGTRLQKNKNANDLEQRTRAATKDLLKEINDPNSNLHSAKELKAQLEKGSIDQYTLLEAFKIYMNTPSNDDIEEFNLKYNLTHLHNNLKAAKEREDQLNKTMLGRGRLGLSQAWRTILRTIPFIGSKFAPYESAESRLQQFSSYSDQYREQIEKRKQREQIEKDEARERELKRQLQKQ